MIVEPSSARQKILDTASSVFAEKGFAGARVDEIARRAQVNKAMLYYHVGNKQALYTAVLTRNFDRMEETLAEALKKSGTARERVEAMIIGIARNLGALPDHPRIVLREMASAGTNLQPDVLERIVRILKTVRNLLVEGIHNGDLRPTDPVMTHLAVIGGLLVLNAVAPLRERVSEIDPEIAPTENEIDVGPFLADLLLRGIATHENGENP
jgi:TetR/AcrR family transcriptional regulator